ncbi:SRPBCC family protein [Aliikangiella coralliicola]|uniref:SRPBCC family protein n=1 Tax=Aliikangiella coralliicola TaxID=2592383 RepID=A0A545U626_9GAMM|nr:SRPBCC family protein [Aliikangiella coralliicola]TQV84863.1 SRPBCC family protein [Aliikangiella coralliicola]
MAIAQFEIEISSSPDEVYKVSQDYSVRYDWDPFPERVQLLNGDDKISKGTRAYVKAKSSLEMEVEFIQVSPPTTTTIAMVKGPIFLDSFVGSWIFKPLDNGRTKAKFRYSIKSKKWALPFITDRLAVLYFRKTVKDRLVGLKSYCEDTFDNRSKKAADTGDN